MITCLKDLKLYLSIATQVSHRSPCKRLKVGAVIVRDDNIISVGHNQMPRGLPSVCEVDGKSSPLVIHAEQDALLRLLYAGPSPSGAAIVVTHSPCQECAKLIIQAGIVAVYYKSEYRDTTALHALRNAGLRVERIRAEVE